MARAWVRGVVGSIALVVVSGLGGGCAVAPSDEEMQSEQQADELANDGAPCDLYAAGNTPCVAAHSTVRALFHAYSGPLYQVQRDDAGTHDIRTLKAGGFANAAEQDTFCSGHECRITKIYDQSGHGNDLGVPAYTHWSRAKNKPPVGAVANAAPLNVGGHNVYGISVTSGDGVAYRNVPGSPGAVTGNAAESMYAVLDGKRSSSGCCFDYGNSEVTGNDDGEGTMEAIYWGTDTKWGGQGKGDGPWIAADLEQGMYKCDEGGPDADCSQWAPSLTTDFVTAMLKGPSGDSFGLKAADAQKGKLADHWNGKRPSHRPEDTTLKPYGPLGADGKPTLVTQEYSPKHLEGAIILGTGGDGSFWGTGTFFEGAMTDGVASATVDGRVQANIVAANYGK